MYNQKEYIKEWRKNNKDKIRKTQRKYYEKNKEQYSKSSLEYYHKNRKEMLKKQKEHYIKNKDKWKIKWKLYYLKNKNNKEFVKMMIIKRMSRKRYSKRKKECSFCGINESLELHHYTQPITIDEVLCSCVDCHSLVHNGEIMEKINIPV